MNKMKVRLTPAQTAGQIVKYAVCIFLAILSILPFYIMIINSTRSSPEIQQSALALWPSGSLSTNYAVFGKTLQQKI